MKKIKTPTRRTVTLPIKEELYKKLKALSVKTGLPIVQIIRLCVINGLEGLEKRLTEDS